MVPSQLLSRRYQSKSIPRQDVLIGFTIQECQDFIKPIFPLLPEIGPGHCFCLVTILTLQIPWTFVVRTEDDGWKWTGRESLGLISSGSTLIKSAPPIWAFPVWGEGVETCLPGWFGTSTTPGKKVPHSAHLTKGGVVKSYFGVLFLQRNFPLSAIGNMVHRQQRVESLSITCFANNWSTPDLIPLLSRTEKQHHFMVAFYILT